MDEAPGCPSIHEVIRARCAQVRKAVTCHRAHGRSGLLARADRRQLPSTHHVLCLSASADGRAGAMAIVAQLVEHRVVVPVVAGSSPVGRPSHFPQPGVLG